MITLDEILEEALQKAMEDEQYHRSWRIEHQEEEDKAIQKIRVITDFVSKKGLHTSK